MKRWFFSISLQVVCDSLPLTPHPDHASNEDARLLAQNCSAGHGDTAKGGAGRMGGLLRSRRGIPFWHIQA